MSDINDNRPKKEFSQGISWEYANMKSLYATIINLMHTKEEIAIIFGESSDASTDRRETTIQLKSRIILNPFTAKRMFYLLNEIVRDYESKYGEIETNNRFSPENIMQHTLMNSMQADEGQGTRGRCNRLMSLINNLNIKYCYEKSVKFLDRKMLVNRFLLSINKKAIGGNARDAILGICREMNMPDSLLKPFDENMAYSDIFHFGFEEDQDRCLYKIYTEPFYEHPEGGPGRKSRSEGLLFYRGFKWDPDHNDRNAIAIYNHYPNLSQQEILERISRIYDIEGNHRNWTPYEIAKDILDIACRKIPQDDILYVEVAEENNPRRSFDVNVYEAKLLLKDVFPVLSRLCRHYSVSESSFSSVLEQAGEDVFGHITGGIDRNGNDFFTVYFGVEYIKWIGIS